MGEGCGGGEPKKGGTHQQPASPGPPPPPNLAAPEAHARPCHFPHHTLTPTAAAAAHLSPIPSGFGIFESKVRKARKGRNPKTGATIQIAAKSYPAFTAGKTFKDRVAGAGEGGEDVE